MAAGIHAGPCPFEQIAARPHIARRSPAGNAELQPVQIANADFTQRRGFAGDLPYAPNGVVVIERLQMILQGLFPNRDALFDHQRRFERAERVSFARSRRVRQLDVVIKASSAPFLP
jgi:hypothetical protein